jgi:hypothetical protein
MKLACLVLAYRGARVLAATAPVYHAAGWDIFVHLDAKGDIARYRADLGKSAALCRFVKPRELVFWGGYSMIRAQLRLIEAAFAAGDYDKFLLISDDTLPLFPPSHLNEVFGADGDFVTLLPEGRGSKNHEAYHRYYYYDHQATTMKGQRTEQGTQIDEAFEAAIADIAALRRRGKKDIALAYGSQFWALGRESLRLVLDTVAGDEHLVKSFQYARLPDELMFQSILLQEKYKGGLHRGPVMADFHSQDGGPRILQSIEGLPFDLEPYQVFARKAAPSAHPMLNAVSDRLLRGQTAWGCAPADFMRGAPVIDEAGDEVPVVTMRLAAPDAAAPRSAAWHSVETYRQQKYRWTGQAEITWTLPLPRLPAGKIRFFLPLIMSKPGFAQQARLSFGNETKPLHITRQSLLAEFDHRGCDAAPTVTLITPEPQPAAPPRDMRHLGLAIGL